ncbi:alpha/beta hydrolase fold domain-containing protein [Nocardia sp. R6R-6]|uniref:alpha/beta hydrolase fold domain-containing protein n=1 Tax=Nocardia sp. R6R-6 TaxID=3459303 RepID=UPI00403D75CE
MSLDPDAQELVTALAEQLPGRLSDLGVDGGRMFLRKLADQAPPGRAVHAVTERSIPGPAGSLGVRVYRPSARDDLPVLLYFHGGGFVLGGLDDADGVCRELALRVECVVVSVDYRLAPEAPFPAAVEDGYAALEWVASNGADIGADPGRIAVGGDSAGAQLAAGVCIVAREAGGPRIALQLLAYPATEYDTSRPSWTDYADGPLLTTVDALWFWEKYLGDVEKFRSDPLVFPMNADLAKLPPAFVLTAEHDPVRDGAEAYAEALAAAGVEVRAQRYDGVFHGFFAMVGLLTKTETALVDAADTLRKYLTQVRARDI